MHAVSRVSADDQNQAKLQKAPVSSICEHTQNRQLFRNSVVWTALSMPTGNVMFTFKRSIYRTASSFTFAQIWLLTLWTCNFWRLTCARSRGMQWM